MTDAIGKRRAHSCVFSRFPAAKSGSVAIYVALTMTVVIGFVALGTEIAYLIYLHRQMQTAADAAALAAATAQSTGFPADPTTEAQAVAAASGFVSGVAGVSLTVSIPPSRGPYQNSTSAVEVIIDQPQTLHLAGLFVSQPVDVSARAVASSAGGQGCALALDPAASGAVTVQGGAAVQLNGCSLAVDSVSTSSLQVGGNASLSALAITLVGGYSTNGQGAILTDDGVTTNAQPVANPYADLRVPAPGPCLQTNYQLTGAKKSATLSPGTYCGGIAVAGGSALTLSPGVYILYDGGLSVAGNATLTGAGVSVVLTGESTGSVNIAGGASISVSAPTNGAFQGVAFFQDPNAAAGGSNSFAGGSTQSVNGAVYFPSQH